MPVLHSFVHALSLSGSMAWEILWTLILGFSISGAIQAVVTHGEMSRLLPDERPRTLALASLLGAASSSCSYAAVALARSIFRKGGNFVAAISFEIASTNLVIELGIIMALLLGWKFTLAEFIGGPIMIAVVALLLRWFARPNLIGEALKQADKGLEGRMEGHAAMDMSVASSGSIWRRLRSSQAQTAMSHFFVMEWTSIWKDIVLGLLIAGATAAWVPDSFFRQLFLTSNPQLASIWGPIIGPIIAAATFVCSIGNVPLAAVLWNSGISFGGVIAFIFADLIIIPILLIYRKYYGTKMTVLLSVAMYVAMVLAGYAVELIFDVLHLTPTARNAVVLSPTISLNYTTVLNVIFLVAAYALVRRFILTGGSHMLKVMNGEDAPSA
jgi:uncharacterized membrane protein YraQ (UPF0718 family)